MTAWIVILIFVHTSYGANWTILDKSQYPTIELQFERASCQQGEAYYLVTVCTAEDDCRFFEDFYKTLYLHEAKFLKFWSIYNVNIEYKCLHDFDYESHDRAVIDTGPSQTLPMFQLSMSISPDKALIQWTYDTLNSVVSYRIRSQNEFLKDINDTKAFYAVIENLKASKVYPVEIVAHVNYRGKKYERASGTSILTMMPKGGLKPVILKTSVAPGGTNVAWVSQLPSNPFGCSFHIKNCPLSGDKCFDLKQIAFTATWRRIPHRPFENHKLTVTTECEWFNGTVKVNRSSDTLQVFTAFKPSAVISLNAVPLNDSSIQVSYKVHANEKSVIKGYQITWGIWGRNQTTINTTNLSYRITGLQHSTRYRISVSAFALHNNKLYMGEDNSKFVSTMLSIPGRVTNLQMKQTPNTYDITASWTPPVNKFPSIPLKFYVNITCGTSDSSSTVTNGKSLKLTVAAKNGDKCLLQVRTATNHTSFVEQKSAAVVSSVIFVGIASPSGCKVTYIPKFTYVFGIAPPHTNDKTKFLYQIALKDQPYPTKKFESSEIILQFMKHYTEYNMKTRVCIENFCGDDYEFSFKTNVGAPGLVRDFSTRIINKTNVFLEWKTPLIKNGPIDGYLISYTNMETKETKGMRLSASNTNYLIISEIDHLSFEVDVSAFNSDVFDHNSVEIGMKTRRFVQTSGKLPPPPSSVDIQLKQNGAELSWKSVSNQDFEIKCYKITFKESKATAILRRHFTVDTKILLENLLPNQEYVGNVSSCIESKLCGRAIRFQLTTLEYKTNYKKLE